MVCGARPSEAQAKGRVLVTGTSGFLGAHIAQQLAAQGYSVRGTMRTEEHAAEMRALVPGIELVTIDLVSSTQSEWDDVVRACTFVVHVAAKYESTPSNDAEVMRPAIEGTQKVMQAAVKASVRRVVVTSGIKCSMAGFYTKNGPRRFTTADWTPDDASLPAMDRAKTKAEREAWRIAEPAKLEVVAILPGAMYGPLLLPRLGESASHVKGLLDGSLPYVPPLQIPACDVRDAAEAHVRALSARSAAGGRFFCYNRTGTSVGYPTVGAWLQERMPDWPVSTKPGGRLMAWLLSIVAPALAPLLNGLPVEFDDTTTGTVLGMPRQSLRTPRETFEAMALSLVQMQLVKKSKGCFSA